MIFPACMRLANSGETLATSDTRAVGSASKNNHTLKLAFQCIRDRLKEVGIRQAKVCDDCRRGADGVRFGG